MKQPARLMIPTFECRVLFSKDCVFADGEAKAGEFRDIPMGLALVGQICGLCTIHDFDRTMNDAMRHIEQYGGDSWWYQPQQTTCILGRAYKLVPLDGTEMGEVVGNA